MLGDEALIKAHVQKKVLIMVPESILSRLMGVIKKSRFEKPQPAVAPGARTAESVARGKRREPLF